MLPTQATNGSKHTWKFFRAGGFDQVDLSTGADLLALDQLDQKLWVALACPTSGLEFDKKTLEMIDADKDGRIRAPELISAVKWAGNLLKNPDDLMKGSPTLLLSAINDNGPEGKALLNSAKTILRNLGKSSALEISLADTTDTARIFAQTAFNGDGIITPDVTPDEAMKTVIRDIIITFGGETDRSGNPGITQPKIDAFFSDCATYDAWVKKSESDAVNILPLGGTTAAAFDALKTLKPKIDDFFGRCRLAAFDQRSIGALNREEKEFLLLAAKDLTITANEVSGFPLATIAPNKALPLRENVNPAWASALETLRSSVVKPFLGDKSELTEADWATLCEKFSAYENWLANKPRSLVEPLGIKRIREILSSPAKETLTQHITHDKAEESNANSIAAVDKLVRLHANLKKLCENFVNFRDFYDGGEPAIFQVGTLFLDQRSCMLCLPVEDVNRHVAMAGMAGTYLAYIDCVRKATGEKMSVLAAFTNGDSDNLMVGRNGLFYDRKGRDWDATITKIVDNPISVRQAFWSPYKKLVRLIEEQVAKRAAAADASANEKITGMATTVGQVGQPKAGTPAANNPKKVDVGTVAALGVAFGALGTALTTFAGYALGILALPFWMICFAFIGMLLVISGPSMLIAYLKLHKRNLGPILDANGWAVNTRARINVPFGESLTTVAKLPIGAQMGARDRFAETPSSWPKVIAFIISVCFVYSLFNHFGLIYQMSEGKYGKQLQISTPVTTNTPSASAPTK